MEAGIAILELERRDSILPNHRIMENHAAPNMQPTLGLVKVQDVASTNTKTLIHLLIIHLLNIEPHCIRRGTPSMVWAKHSHLEVEYHERKHNFIFLVEYWYNRTYNAWFPYLNRGPPYRPQSARILNQHTNKGCHLRKPCEFDNDPVKEFLPYPECSITQIMVM